MDNTIGSESKRIAITPDMPFLSGKDLMEEAMKLPPQVTDLGHGVTVIRRGAMIKIEGAENLSPHASIAAMRAADMSGAAGRAMFDTYYKNNPSEVDGSRTFDAILRRAAAPLTAPRTPPRPSAGENGVTEVAGHNAEAKGTDDSDVLTGGRYSTLFGGDGDDWLSGDRGSTLYGGAGDDILYGGTGATLFGGDGDDRLEGSLDSYLDGGDGDDELRGTYKATLSGDAGDDRLSAYGDSTLLGGAGNDRLSGYRNGTYDGGEGDDFIEGYDNSSVRDAAGDNFVSVYRDSDIVTGDGDDWISAYSGAVVRAGGGNNMVTAYSDSSVTSGSGGDMIDVGAKSVVVSGDGDDLIKAGRSSFVDAGRGDDRVTLGRDSTYHFRRGDGRDILGGGRWGAAYRDTDNLASSVIAFGDGISVADLTFQAEGNDLTVDLGQGDSIVLRDYQRHGIASMTFADGSTLSSQDIAAAVGPGDAYQAESQVIQNWHDANAAYRKAQAEANQS